jgi:hypothetical protein
MNTTIPFPTRYLAIMVVALAGAALFLVVRPMLVERGGETVAPAPPTATPKPTPPAAKPEPKVALLPGLPAKVAGKLRHSKVLVVALYQGAAPADRAAVTAAGKGARSVRAEFLPVNVLNEATARKVQAFVGTTTTPAVVVVRRPGRIVSRLEGAASSDEQLVAQAAHNAGARNR